MAAALTAGVTRPDEMINCMGGLLMIGKRQLHDSHAHGWLTATHVLAESSNIGMAILGMRLGNKRMHEYLSGLGFGEKTGIDLRGEGVGLFLPLKKWTSSTTPSVPMGHEMAVTPIQIITAFSALVNGGSLVQPRVVAAVVDADGNVVEDHTQPVIRRQVVEPHVVSQMRDMLVSTVNEGTGRSAQMERYQLMGKTGTAQLPRKDRHGYEDGAYLSSFMAAGPASDPQLVCLVMIRKPNKKFGYYGSAVSAPVVKAIFEQALPYLNVPPDKEPPPPKGAKVASAR
jgi:cell division protein FtsI/penicillin-binding protein 2